ncbi:MAG: hypothetical protein BWY88_00059 [Synergistetes bacterium ADurb.Bin520]|nr:MAG: hypothetical protein BWY88_00059 [Synergistetes bacterium ADurb.Bin520]
MSSAKGLVWSMNWESCPDPKNSRSEAEMGRTLMSSRAVAAARSGMVVMRSLAMRSMRSRPMRTWFCNSSPTARTRRFPR